MKKVAILLGGAGYLDGSEIHESVLTILELEKNGASWQAISVNKSQYDVVDHNTSKTLSDDRSVLVESGRVTRGNVLDIKLANVEDFDAVIIPGGFGVAKNFCDFASAGENMVVDENIKNFLVSFKQTNRPIGALCIAPVLLARIFGELNPEVTVGDNVDIEKVLASWGAKPQKCSVDDCVIDRHNKFVSSPAYMLGRSIIDISAGVEKLVKETLAMA